MEKDLTTSQIDRQNILNNPYALAEIEKAAGIQGIPFEGKAVVLKEQVASFFEVTVRTVENYLEQNAEELARNGYEVLKGKRLKTLKLSIQQLYVPEIDFGNIRESENISYHVAAGSISKELLGEWMSAILRGNEDNEVLKLKILNAISKGEL